MQLFGYTVNPLAIGLSAVAAFLLGYLWYGLIFEAQWLAGHAFTPEQLELMPSQAPTAMAVSFIGYLVTATVLSIIFSYCRITDLRSALFLTALIWLGFPAMMILMNTMYSFGSLTLFFIDAGYQLVYTLIMAFILNWMS